MSEVRIDARGLRCPWPALRLARAMREGGAGARVRIAADDPAAPREIQALAAEQGWIVEPADLAAREFIVTAPGA
ncbi:MAG: putative redox protein [Sphingomonas bacterium]|nr:putative redox protein [Sphingomonas bacterium]